jgi:hypothetical protein
VASECVMIRNRERLADGQPAVFVTARCSDNVLSFGFVARS